MDGGFNYYVRRTDILRDMKISKDETTLNINKTINVADELLIRNAELQKTAQEESKRDRTFEEF